MASHTSRPPKKSESLLVSSVVVQTQGPLSQNAPKRSVTDRVRTGQLLGDGNMSLSRQVVRRHDASPASQAQQNMSPARIDNGGAPFGPFATRKSLFPSLGCSP